MSKLLVYPLDVIKKRLQVQGFEKARLEFGAVRSYSGVMNCVRQTMAEEGVRGLFKGLSPSLVKAAAVAGLNMMVYEQIRKAFVAHHARDES